MAYVCPKCGWKDSPCWRNARFYMYCTTCRIDELEEFEPDIAKKLKEETPIEISPFHYKLTRYGWVYRTPIKLKDSLPKENQIGSPYFKNLMLNITEKCNLTCKHCYITNKNPIDFPFDKLKEIIKGFHDLQGIKIILTGGEPYLYSHLNFK